MISHFEILAKKFAVIFEKLGIVKNDIVHFIICDEDIIPVALSGLWILGAIGSLGNKYNLQTKSVELNTKMVSF